MATIVRSKKSGMKFILLGCGFGMYESNFSAQGFGSTGGANKGEHTLMCVCNAKGKIGWFESDDVEVISIDGQEVSTLF